MGYKLKTKKSAVRRFWKSTATGKIRRGIKGHGHFLSKKGQGARALQGTAIVDDNNFDMVDRLLPYRNAKRKRTKALRRALQRATTATSSAAKSSK